MPPQEPAPPARPRAAKPAPLVERRATPRPEPTTSGRCAYCGSRDTFAIAPERFEEWALERWGDAALLRCHDCGRRQAVSGLAPARGVEWRLGVGVAKLFGWVFLAAGLGAGLLFLMRRNDGAGGRDPAPFRLPRERSSPSAPAPSPSSGPFSLRSTPSTAA